MKMKKQTKSKAPGDSDRLLQPVRKTLFLFFLILIFISATQGRR